MVSPLSSSSVHDFSERAVSSSNSSLKDLTCSTTSSPIKQGPLSRVPNPLVSMIVSFLPEKGRAKICCVSQLFCRAIREYEKTSSILRVDNFIMRFSHQYWERDGNKTRLDAAREVMRKRLDEGPTSVATGKNIFGSSIEEVLLVLDNRNSQANSLDEIQTGKSIEESILEAEGNVFINEAIRTFGEEIRARQTTLEEINLHFSSATNLGRQFASKNMEFLAELVKMAEQEVLPEKQVKPFQRLKKLAFYSPKSFASESLGLLRKINKITFPLIHTVHLIGSSSGRSLLFPLDIPHLILEESYHSREEYEVVVEKTTLLTRVVSKMQWNPSSLPINNLKLFANFPKLKEFQTSFLFPGEFYVRENRNDVTGYEFHSGYTNVNQREILNNIFSSLKDLTSLTLVDMRSWDVESLCARIAGLTKLERLSLSFSEKIYTVNEAAGAEGIVKLIQCYLDRRSKVIAGSTISQMFCSTLSHLKLNLRYIDANVEFINRLVSLPSLKTLILDFNEGRYLSLNLYNFYALGKSTSIRYLEFRNIFARDPSRTVDSFRKELESLKLFCGAILGHPTFRGSIKIVENRLSDGMYAELSQLHLDHPRVSIGRRSEDCRKNKIKAICIS